MITLLMLLSFYDSIWWLGIVTGILCAGLAAYGIYQKKNVHLAPYCTAFAVFYFLYGISIYINPVKLSLAGEGVKYLLTALLFLISGQLTNLIGVRKSLLAIEASLMGVGFLSIECATTGVLTKLVLEGICNRLGCHYEVDRLGYEAGERLIGIFGNGNILASLMGVAILIALYLYLTGQKKTGFFFFGYSLILFLLAQSRGMLLAMIFAVAFAMIVSRDYILPIHFVRGITLALVSLVSQMVIERLIVSHSFIIKVLTLIVVCIFPILLYGLDTFIKKCFAFLPMKVSLGKKGKWISVAAIVIILGLMFCIKGDIHIHKGEDVIRMVRPDAGVNTCLVDSDGEVYMRLTSRSRREVLSEKNTELFAGKVASTVTLEIPSDSEGVMIEIAGEGSIHKITFVGRNRTITVPGDWILLPNTLQNRLQGIWMDKNVLQRIELYQDGYKLWQKGILFGHGAGSFSYLQRSVQTYFYEIKYVHNQFLQCLVDLGIVGLFLFIGCCILFMRALWMNRKNAKLEVLFASMFFIVIMIHGLVDVDFNTATNLFLYAFLFGIIGNSFEPSQSKRTLAKERIFGLLVLALCGYICFFCIGHMYSVKSLEQMLAGEKSVTKAEINKCARFDVTGQDRYQLYYVSQMVQDENLYPEVITMIDELRDLQCYEIDKTLIMDYYLAYGKVTEAYEVALEALNWAKSDTKSWDGMIELFRGFDEFYYQNSAYDEAYQQGRSVLKKAYIDAREQIYNLGELSEENMHWLMADE